MSFSNDQRDGEPRGGERAGAVRPEPGKRSLVQRAYAGRGAVTPAPAGDAGASTVAPPVDDPFGVHLGATVAAPSPQAALRTAAAADPADVAGDVPVHRGAATAMALSELGVRGASVDGRAFVSDGDPALVAHEVAHARGADEAGADRAARGLPAGLSGSAAGDEVQAWGGRTRPPSVSLRPSPSGEHGEFPALAQGTRLEVLDEQLAEGFLWLHVRVADGRVGYVAHDSIERDAAPAVADRGESSGGGASGGQRTGGERAGGERTDGERAGGGTAGRESSGGAVTIGGGAVTTGGGPALAGANAAEGPRPRPADLSGRRPIDGPRVNGQFLGRAVRRAHPVLIERLARAEAHLLSTVTVPSGQTLGQVLGIHEAHKVDRTDNSYHSFGLAIDINYTTNPYVGGDRDAGTAVNQQSLAVIWRAVWLTGQGAAISSRDSHERSGRQSSGDLYDHFAGADQALETYLGLAHDPTAAERIGGWLAAGNLGHVPAAPGRVPPDLLHRRDLATADAARWLAQARADRGLIRGGGASNWRQGSSVDGPMRPTSDRAAQGDHAAVHGELGFMDLDRRLVIALRDIGGLLWGAADFEGETAQGDFMHFECGYDYTLGEVQRAAAARAREHPAGSGGG